MEFKKVIWEERSYKDSLRADVPFIKILEIRLIKGSFYWEMHNGEYVEKSGSCNNIEKAKDHAEKCFQKYVKEELSKC